MNTQMKRVLAVMAGATLILAATAVAGSRQPTTKEIAAHRERAAAHQAKALLREFVAPPGAHRIPSATGDTGSWPAGKVVDRHRFWVVSKAVNVAAFVGTQKVRGVKARRSGNGPHVFSWNFSWPAKGVIRRLLTVTAIPRRTRTTLRVDAKVVWIYPRPRSEQVPARVRQISLDTPKIHRKVTDGATVKRIVRWFDALPVSPPGVSVPCGPVPGADITLSFRSAGSRTLARAELPSIPAGICDSISFAIGGRSQMPLIDNYYPYRESFLGHLQRLLGVRLLLRQR